MRNREATLLGATILAVFGHVSPATVVSSEGSRSGVAPRDNVELRRLRDEDQRDRAPAAIDWTVVTPRDRARLKRVKELIAADGLHTANDYVRSALILQHGEAPDDFLLAHEFCVAAMVLGKNDRESASLAAAAEDRYLMNAGRPQRFGTQFTKGGAGPWRLHPVGDGVTDALRRVMAVPSLAEARAREAEMNARAAPDTPATRPPIIDMHLHAHALSAYGTPPPTVCTNDQDILFPGFDPREAWTQARVKSCRAPVSAPATDEDLLREVLALLERYNIRAVTTGPLEQVTKWRAAASDRIIPGVPFDDYEKRDPETFRRLFTEGRFAVFAEISSQYNGLSPADASLEPYFALAEELDIPVGIHMGEGPPGGPHRGFPGYRARQTSPFLLEEVLIRHPRLRVYVMHYGSPLVDEMISMLYSHPQLYVDTGGNNWLLPRKQFHDHLRRLMEAGFGERIMFGSDAMVWPRTIEVAIQSIETAEFLTPEQKRNIFYDNAARFLRLKAQTTR